MIEYTQTELRIMALFTAIGAVFSWLIGGIDNAVSGLLVLIGIDYVSGMMAAWKTGTLNSQKGFIGIRRKLIMLVVVVIAHQIDDAIGNKDTLRNMVIFAYSGNEALSIVENIDRMGYGEYMPQVLRDKLSQIRNEKGGKQ